MIYLFGWAGCLLVLMISGLTHYRGRFFVFILLLFFLGVAFLRGAVGTDTANYERMFADFIDIYYIWTGREPGFVALGWLLATLAPTIEAGVRLISVVFFALIALFVARADKNELFLLLAYIFPAFAYQYSMNALRIGLASAFILLMVQEVRLKDAQAAIKFGVAAALFHYTVLLSIVILFLSQQAWGQLSTVVKNIVLLVLLSFGLLSVDFYVADKLEVYTSGDYSKPSALSGLSILIPNIIILVGILFSFFPRAEKFKLFFLFLLVFGSGMIITQFTYAGLRILNLGGFVMPLCVLASYSRLGLKFGRKFKFSLLAAGLLSAIGVYRGFLIGYGEGPSPFLPYTASFSLF